MYALPSVHVKFDGGGCVEKKLPLYNTSQVIRTSWVVERQETMIFCDR